MSQLVVSGRLMAIRLITKVGGGPPWFALYLVSLCLDTESLSIENVEDQAGNDCEYKFLFNNLFQY